MRAAVLALLLLATGSLSLPAATSTALPRVQLFGREYVALSGWARAHYFTLEWRRKNVEVVLRSERATLAFTVNSRRMEINGVSAWLSFPIAQRNGAIYISPRDLQTLVEPILYPTRYRPEKRIRSICLDPGHGGKDPGNQEGSRQEKRYTLLLATELRTLLEKAGLNVVLTRSYDGFLDPYARPVYAKRRRADLFVSLHYNSANNGKGPVNGINGAEVYCMTPAGASSTNARGEGANTGALPGNLNDQKNVLLAYYVQRSMVKTLPMADRGLRRARFAVLATAEVPAILVESGFMSDPAEAKRIYDPAFRKRTAQAIAEGILAYKRIVGG